MKTENKIIRFLIETRKEPTIRDLSKGIKADYKIVHTAVMRLTGKGLLEKRKVGKAFQLIFNYKLSKESFEVELGRRNEILMNKNIRVMLDTIKSKIESANFVLLLFGSYSKKKANKMSDIDLMFVIPADEMEKRIEHAISILPFKIHYFVFTEKQFIDMKDSRQKNVVHEAIKNNIILHGIEQYYELIGGDLK